MDAHFQVFFQHYGLIAVFVTLLLENLGLPLPGEVALLYAGYHSRAHGSFGLAELAVTASAACILGQIIGYGVGRYAGNWARRVLDLSGGRTATLEAYFHRHGPLTILFARFIAGLRVFAGPVAGLCKMAWGPFLSYSAIGAVLWVVAVSQAGALLGAHWHRLLRLAGRVDIVILVIAAAAIGIAWHRLRRGENRGAHHG